MIESVNSSVQFYSIEKTKYGGRGCFAIQEIPKDTIVHVCDSALSWTVAKPFRKEVCYSCFKYEFGQYMKYKISKKIGKDQCSIWFCSSECENKFRSLDPDQVLVNNLLYCEKHYLNGLNKSEIETIEPKTSLDQTIIEEWENVDIWDQKVNSMKPSKSQNLIPRIDDSEYLEIKYCIGILFQMYKSGDNYELSLFHLLQSSEIDKYQKYPYLLHSYINIYKFLRLTCSPELQKFINPGTIRSIIGKNLSNAFGIWSETTTPNEDKEFLGFGVYPSASFFNHSCEPNLVKIRKQNRLEFKAIRNIEVGEEICINYGNYSNETVSIRQKELKEWFFECQCKKCVHELFGKVIA